MSNVFPNDMRDYAAERLIGWNRSANLAIEGVTAAIAQNFDDADVLGIDWRQEEDKQEATIFLGHLGFKNFVNGLPHYDTEPDIHVTGKRKELHTYIAPLAMSPRYRLRERRVVLPREGFPVMSLFRVEKASLR